MRYLRRRAALLLTAGAATVALAGCGLPSAGQLQTVPDGDVPYGLARTPTPTATGTVGVAGRPREFWARADNSLQGVRVRLSTTQTPAQLAELLRLLAAGPTTAERSAGLDTAFSPSTTFAVRQLRSGTADVDVRSGGAEPAADRLPSAVGQLVLTATSVPGVTRVRLFRDGKLAQGQLPGGATTDEPLTADDFAQLRPPTTAAPTTSTSSTPVTPTTSVTR